jgi:hypothetical protein
MATINVLAEDTELPSSFLNGPHLLRGPGDDNKSAFVLSCATQQLSALGVLCAKANRTMYDTEHTVVDDTTAVLSTLKSNGSVTGMVSMTSLASLRFRALGNTLVMFEVNRDSTFPKVFMETYATSMSKRMRVPLVVHTVPAPATLAQRRVTSVITKLLVMNDGQLSQ